MKITQLEIHYGKPNGKQIWKSIQNGPTPHPMITDPPSTDSAAMPAPRKKLNSEFSEEENKLEMADTQAEIILSQGLPRHICTTSAPALSSPSTPSPQPTAQSSNDALMATMTQIANLLSGFQKQFPPTNNQLRTSSNSKTHATVHDGQIVTEPIQRKAPGNVGNTGARGKKVICYNCRGEGHVARQCKEPKRKMDSQYFKDKALLMEAKEKGDVLDAEAEAFLADVECTAHYDQPQALTTTNMFQANHEDAYDSDVDEGPNAAVAFMANLSSTSATNNPVNEVHSNDNQIFDNVDYQLSQEMHQEEHLDSDAETEIDDNTIPYHQYLLDTEAQNVPTEVSADTSDKVSMIAILTDLQTQLDGHAKVNQEKCLEIETKKFQASKSATPATPFVRKSRPPSQVLASLRKVNAVFPQFEGIIKERTTQKPDYVSEWCFDYAKQFVEQQLVPFYDHFKKHIQAANDTFFKEIKEFEQIFDELEAEYEQCVLDNKNLTIEKKNLLIRNDCLIAECLEKDICSIVLTSDIVVPPSSNCLCEDLRSACDREHTKVLELEAEISKQKQLFIESEKRFAFLEQNYVCLQLKFQNYKQCIDTSSASNAIFEINKLRQQLQGKDDTIRNLDAQINIMKVLNANTLSRTAYTENTKLVKDQVTGTTSSGTFKPSDAHTKCLLQNVQLSKTHFLSRKTVPKRAPRNHSSLPAKSANARRVEAHHRTLNKKNRRDSNLLVKHSISVSNLNNDRLLVWYLDSGCSRHMTGDRARLINFVEKFIGTVRFGNDEYAAIVGYGDYKLGDTIISRVYYVEGLKHNLFSVGQFCDGGLEVAFRQHSCHIRNYDMVDLLKGSRTTNLYSISLNDMMSASPVCLLTKPLPRSHGYGIVG
ncbi:integrase, catalytic region, zinc finger, CCHC-type containing protein [Tanacetum coccineum]|uniref:Integrase, catalytic region, zinc finger, CCHC-type containing protein n=1 Tax=Tanacetum coccineum TaxID=301880 RepID=A0ABQ5GLC0_9ASTR